MIINSYIIAPNTGPVQLYSGDAAALDSEANSINAGWTNSFNLSVQTTQVNGSTYALRCTSSGTFGLSRFTFTGLGIGDSITIEFDAICNSQAEQGITLNNTNDNSDFLPNGSQPLTYTSYSRTVTLTADNFYIQLLGRQAGGVSGDYVTIDNLSVIKN